MRNEVLWIGAPPDDATRLEYDRRHLRLRSVPAVHPSDAVDARAAVFSLGDQARPEVVETFRKGARLLLEFGIHVQVAADTDAAMGAFQLAGGQALGLPGIRTSTAHAAHVLAEQAARHEPGAAPKLSLDIVLAGNREPLREEDRRLLQRAFSDCTRIALVELTGGRSDARVFAVHMTVAGSNAGLWPQPAFAKLDRREKIEVEHSNYREYADRFIPFGLRPNIHDMVLGPARGILVGNFVDRSESLWDLARRNVAAHAINSLIDETLGGWRDQAYASDPKEGSVAEAMQAAGLVRPKDIKGCYAERAAAEGIDLDPASAWAKLANLRHRYRECPCHGDLHGENVRVRNGHAILIDLASVSKGALTLDLAALETWLAFQLPPDVPEDDWADPQWRAEIERLYAPEAFLQPPGPAEPTGRLCWMSTAVRQLRHRGLAVQSCPTEYQAAVAIQLLRRCQWDDGPNADRYRRGLGYVMAARLINDLETKA